MKPYNMYKVDSMFTCNIPHSTYDCSIVKIYDFILTYIHVHLTKISKRSFEMRLGNNPLKRTLFYLDVTKPSGKVVSKKFIQ